MTIEKSKEETAFLFFLAFGVDSWIDSATTPNLGITSKFTQDCQLACLRHNEFFLCEYFALFRPHPYSTKPAMLIISQFKLILGFSRCQSARCGRNSQRIAGEGEEQKTSKTFVRSGQERVLHTTFWKISTVVWSSQERVLHTVNEKSQQLLGFSKERELKGSIVDIVHITTRFSSQGIRRQIRIDLTILWRFSSSYR